MAGNDRTTAPDRPCRQRITEQKEVRTNMGHADFEILRRDSAVTARIAPNEHEASLKDSRVPGFNGSVSKPGPPAANLANGLASDTRDALPRRESQFCGFPTEEPRLNAISS